MIFNSFSSLINVFQFLMMTPHYFCDQCGQGFETRRQLISHLPTHRSEVFACRQCEKKFILNTKLKSHVREKHSKENTCLLCGSRFGHLASLNNHVKEVHEKVKADTIACIEAAHQRLDQIWQWYIIKWQKKKITEPISLHV